MADDFEISLASALAPPQRLPDRCFVAQVQARIALDDQLAGERRVLVLSLASQLAALLAVAAGIAVIARADILVGMFVESPAVGLAILLLLFSFVVLVLSKVGSTGGHAQGSQRLSELR